jgi:hypothetical protein
MLEGVQRPVGPADAGEQIIRVLRYYGLPLLRCDNSPEASGPRIPVRQQAFLLVLQSGLVVGGGGGERFLPLAGLVQLGPGDLEPLAGLVEPVLDLVGLHPQEFELLLQVAGHQRPEPGAGPGLEAIQASDNLVPPAARRSASSRRTAHPLAAATG